MGTKAFPVGKFLAPEETDSQSDELMELAVGQLREVLDDFEGSTDTFQLSTKRNPKDANDKALGPYEFKISQANKNLSLDGLGQLPFVTQLMGLTESAYSRKAELETSYNDKLNDLNKEQFKLLLDRHKFESDQKAWESEKLSHNQEIAKLKEHYTKRESQFAGGIGMVAEKFLDKWIPFESIEEGGKALAGPSGTPTNDPPPTEAEELIEGIALNINDNFQDIENIKAFGWITDQVAKDQTLISKISNFIQNGISQKETNNA